MLAIVLESVHVFISRLCSLINVQASVRKQSVTVDDSLVLFRIILGNFLWTNPSEVECGMFWHCEKVDLGEYKFAEEDTY